MKKLKFESALRIPRTHPLHWALYRHAASPSLNRKRYRPSHAPCTHPHSANSQNRFGDTGSGWLPDWIHSDIDILLAQTNRKLWSQKGLIERACSVFQQGLMVDPSELWRQKKGSFLGVKISQYFWLGQSLKTCIHHSFFFLLPVVLLPLTFDPDINVTRITRENYCTFNFFSGLFKFIIIKKKKSVFLFDLVLIWSLLLLLIRCSIVLSSHSLSTDEELVETYIYFSSS